MKKRLEAELISIAHRVLKLKNKSEIDQLYHETQKLYEALTFLKFYCKNYELFSYTHLDVYKRQAIITPTANSLTFPVIINFLNSFNIID